MDADAASSRSKAAAWAWYQHHIGLSARPEAFASAPDTRPRPPLSPSRFKLEAALLLASITNQKQLQAKAASPESEGVVSFLLPANLRTDVNDCPTDIDPPRTSAAHKEIVSLAPDDDEISSSSPNLVLTLSYAGMAAWDCGSSLFDSFELVAVSKKLECAHQINAFSMDKVCPPAPNITSAALDEQQEDEDEEVQPSDSVEVLPCKESAFFLPTAWVNVEEPIAVPRPHGQINREFEPTSHPDQKHRKQEVCDMFCRYGPRMNCGCDDVNYDDVKKPKPRRQAQHRMPRLRRLSRVFRRIAHLAPSSSDAHREHSKSQRPHMQSHRLRQVPLLKTQQLLPHYNRIAVDGTASNPLSAGDRAPAGDMFHRNNKYSDHMQQQQQHHHHNHYHYLFHHESDESFGALQPTLAGADKSFMVAAAGLRTPRVSALQRHPPFNGSSCKMDGAVLDYKRKWRDLNAA